MLTTFLFRLFSVLAALALVVTGLLFLFAEGSKIQGAVLVVLGIFSFFVSRNVCFSTIPNNES